MQSQLNSSAAYQSQHKAGTGKDKGRERHVLLLMPPEVGGQTPTPGGVCSQDSEPIPRCHQCRQYTNNVSVAISHTLLQIDHCQDHLNMSNSCEPWVFLHFYPVTTPPENQN